MALYMNAQSDVKPEQYRYIYLWDVTLSMKGYGGAPDIYDDVVEYLYDGIDGLPNGKNREIIVCPFQEEILDTWKEVCTIEGKNNMKKRISNFNNDSVTCTNLVDPLKYVEHNYVDTNYITAIYLLTDGNQNAKNASESFEHYLDCSKWSRENRFSHLIIIKLIPNILENIGTGDGYDVLEGQEISLEITPTNRINYNIIEANKNGCQEIKVAFSPNPTDETIPEGVKIRVHSAQNSIIKVDEILTIENGTLTIPLNYDYEDLKTSYQGKESMMLYYDIQKDSQRIKRDKDVYVISVASSMTKVDVVNEPQKTLKITLK